MINAATPPLKTPAPRVFVPSRNVTVPVAALGATTEVRVTLAPYVEGFRLDASVLVVAVELTLATTTFTEPVTER